MSPADSAAGHVPRTLNPAQWREATAHHEARADRLTADHRDRRSRGQRHPVWDFMFEYYPVSPGKLRRWSPGVGTLLADASASDLAHLKFFTESAAAAGLAFDARAYVGKRGKTVRYVRDLLEATRRNPTHFDCFGLHEWAMVYRQGEHRHPEPLRLGQAGTDAVVDAHTVRCTHFDAFRFFTPEAVGLNVFSPTRQTQPQCEQAGCLHANMDLYKWATKLGEAVPGEVWLDTFELACSARELDMRAAPYDLAGWGFEPIRIETPEGKAEYVRRQREISREADGLRDVLIDITERVLAEASRSEPVNE
nr:3-methyladenine DNA glycosylase [Corynebacterium lactis]